MNPAWPSENWPLNPLISCRLTAMMTATPTCITSSRLYAPTVPRVTTHMPTGTRAASRTGMGRVARSERTAGDGGLVAQGLVGADGVVHAPPGLGVGVEVGAVVAAGVEEDELADGRPVEPLDLALRLGVVRAAVGRADAEADEAGVEPAQAV